MAKQQKISAEQAKLAQQAQESGTKYQFTLEQIADIQDKILQGQIKTSGELARQLATSRQLTAQLKGEQILRNKIASDQQKAQERAKKAQEEVAKLQDETLDLAGKYINSLQQMGKENRSNLQQDLAKNLELRRQTKEKVKQGKLSKIEAHEILTSLRANRGLLKGMDAINEKAPLLAEAMKEAGNLASEVQGKIDGFFDNIPGGGVLKKALGLDQVEKQLSGGINAGISAIGQGLAAGKSPLQALNMGFKAFNATVMLNPVVLVIAAVVALAVLVKKLVGAYGEFEKQARNTAESMGISVVQGKEMVKNAQDASTAFGVNLVNAKEVLSVQTEISNELGNSSMISADVAANVADTGKAFGYGVKAAGELQGVFQSMGVASADAATMQMELGKETLAQGVNTGKVIADINSNAAKTNKFFRGDVKALTKAAVEANKMGISIADMAKVAESLLDFENSIGAQFEFQALTVKEINLDLARQLAFQGDIAGATKEVLKNIGSLSEFNEMLPHQQEAFAKAAGLSVD